MKPILRPGGLRRRPKLPLVEAEDLRRRVRAILREMSSKPLCLSVPRRPIDMCGGASSPGGAGRK